MLIYYDKSILFNICHYSTPFDITYYTQKGGSSTLHYIYPKINKIIKLLPTNIENMLIRAYQFLL